LQRTAGPYIWVNGVVLTARRPIPVHPDEQTFSMSVGMSQRGQFRTHAPQQIRPIRHLVAAAEQRMRYHRIDRDRGFAGRPADVWSNADSWVAKPSQAVQYRRD